MFRTPSLVGRAAATLLLFGGLVAVVRAEDPTKTREQEIADIQKKLADLQKKLDELNSKGKSAAATDGKKPLTLAEVETWRSVRGVGLSPDGKWFAHRVGPNEGDGDLILRNTADGKETKFAGGSAFGTMQFSLDSKWFAFTHTPFVKGASGSPAPGTPRPKSKVVLVNLGSGEKTEIEGASSFRFNGEAATHFAFRKVSEPSAAGPPAPGAPAPPTGTDLVLRELATGTDLVLGNVADFEFDKKGAWMVTTIDAAGQLGNGVHLRNMKTGAVGVIESGKAGYRSLVWNEETTAFTVTKQTDDAAYDKKAVSVVGFTDLGPKPTKTAYDPTADKDFPADMAITGSAAWTDALDGFTFNITAQEEDRSRAAAQGGEGGHED